MESLLWNYHHAAFSILRGPEAWNVPADPLPSPPRLTSVAAALPKPFFVPSATNFTKLSGGMCSNADLLYTAMQQLRMIAQPSLSVAEGFRPHKHCRKDHSAVPML